MTDAALPTLAAPFTPRPDYWRRWRESSALPGFRLAFGFTLFYVGLIILLPLAALVARPWEHGVSGFVDAVTGPRTLAALRLSFFGAAFAALANVLLGVAVAWVLTRYEFPGRSVLDALVDLPFALPTAVAGVALATLYGPNGWIGGPLLSIGVKVAYTPLGVFVALLAVGLPYVVRSVQPVLEDMEAALEEAAQTLGASTWQVATRIVSAGARARLAERLRHGVRAGRGRVWLGDLHRREICPAFRRSRRW